MDPLPAPGAPSGAAPRAPRRPGREGRPATRERDPAARPLRAVAVAPDRAVTLTRAVVLIIQAVHVAVAAHQPATSARGALLGVYELPNSTQGRLPFTRRQIDGGGTERT